MSDPRQQIHELFRKLISNQCTEQELAVFFRLVKELPDNDELIAALDEWWQTVPEKNDARDLLREQRIRQHIHSLIHSREAGKPAAVVSLLTSGRIWWAAAVVFLLVSAGLLIWLLPGGTPQTAANAAGRGDQHIGPGKNGAILTLADGTQVVLDSLDNGVIASQQGAQVTLHDGRLAYSPHSISANSNVPGEVAYNVMTTPKSRQFHLLLSDGTKVWLNAASSIRYPTAFTGKERRVEVTGEVYFDVAKNTLAPFRVTVGNSADIEVLGTQFNIQAYDDGPGSVISTTLIEGAVSVSLQRVLRGRSERQRPGSPPHQAVILKPGQQALIGGTTLQNNYSVDSSATSGITVLSNIDLEKVVAWKKGLFNFNGARLPEVMKQLERWYDIEVVYEKGIPDITVEGEMTNGVTLNDLMIVLEKLDIHSRLEGRKLIVTP